MTWPVVPISEVAEIVSGATPKTSVAGYWEGEINWATPADLSKLDGVLIGETPRKITESGLKSCAATVLPPNSVLFSSRAPIGLTAINTVPMATNQGFKSFMPNTAKLEPKFLYWWLRSNRTKLESLGNGATFKEVSKTVISRVKIPLPPLEEQKRIAAILDKADQLRQKRRQAVALLDSLTQSIFVEMFGDIEANPRGWQMIRLSELIAPDDRLNYGVVQPDVDDANGIPLIRVSDLRMGTVNRSRLRKISRAVNERHAKSILKGTEILVSCVGTIGEISLVSPEDKGSNIARAVARVPLCDKVNRVFVASYLRTSFVQNYFTRELRTVSQPTLNIKQISETPVPIVHDNLASEFEKRVGMFNELLQTHLLQQTALESLFASLQARAFAGEL